MMMSLVFVDVFVSIRVVVEVLKTELKAQFSLRSVEDQVGVIAPPKGTPDML